MGCPPDHGVGLAATATMRLEIDTPQAPRQHPAMRVLIALSITVLLAASWSRAEEDPWKEYKNARFGFLLRYPASLVGSRAPDNGGGREYHTKDKEFSVAAFAYFLSDDDSFDKRWEGELKDLGDTITYKKKAKNWYVVSGVAKDGTEYYHKFFASGANVAGFQITYPRAKNSKYDPWVERIAKEFVPFLKGDYDRIK